MTAAADPNNTGLSGLTRGAAFAACLQALRLGETSPHALEEEYGPVAFAAAQRALTGSGSVVERKAEIVEALASEMHFAPKGSTRVAAGSTLLKCATVVELKKLEAERAFAKDPTTRAEAAKELTDLEGPLFDLLLDVWVNTQKPPPRAVELITQLVDSPAWAPVLLAAGWSRQ